VTERDRWLGYLWPLIRTRLPSPPARVLDVGCGPRGGFVPVLRGDGYKALGIDPRAPEGAHYQQIDFEHAELPAQVDAVVASTSLHHVDDPARVLDRIVATLAGGGTVVVVEWAWETFDRQTADWCFERLGAHDDGWLRRRRDEWLASGREWSDYLWEWAQQEGLHAGRELVRLLDERLARTLLARGPYFFADLPATSEADEQAAIDAGRIRPARIDYVGKRG
jgi:SAM-dependent methyltransferase